ncbi:acetyl-/propionyl-CoA carboxylase subunit alpha [Corynebacterium sp. CNJ-954]|uniref:acetyl/propionyl/methylcrotonyl-CoA carboxylase subunit alpha n=1 Tax=Corynebacterium sp. CNJ-954 TaxID=1904962 RepID=UPI00095C5547|nr:biotin carboxylase N-terminal domain-containing protein [Corynebacterium sp. CNJ-954]OLT56125.1 acetyl-/propionyl-CoA carboxylase subunit alpha [Corynebacterium sp. CNJ-954]
MPVETRKLSKVLIANRGEIAVRVIRAARDEGITSVAVYAEPDADAPFVRMADEAFALGGSTPADSYLDIGKVVDAAVRSGADAVHPGYGFLSERADFAAAVVEAGLTWIGPSPNAIAELGDKVTARHYAQKVDAPMVPGTSEPVADAGEIIAFAGEHGLPVAIKAAFGGGGRGMKVAHTVEEIPELFDSATREAEKAFGRGECFVERYLDRARHVECQVLADAHGNYVVASTRDCSLQRRFQKLVEEAPAPFLTADQDARLRSSAKDILRAAGYQGAGTVEFLIGSDGLISFLEVNTRLQVEHPVTEEVAGWDLVREQFRIAEGRELSRTSDPELRGHSIEFRINGEDAAANFMPAPGALTTYREPSGPGVRVDSGVEQGAVIGGQFDSMLAKLIVTGDDREQALSRARRALDEYVVEGLPTVIPFHRAVLDDPAFTGDSLDVYTRWIEEEWDNQLATEDTGNTGSVDAAEAAEAVPARRITVEVDGRRVEVSVPGDLVGTGGPRRRARKSTGRREVKVSGDTSVAPMQGTVVTVLVEDGAAVAEGDQLLVIEAMKMENAVKAHKAGTVCELGVAAGDGVTKSQPLLKIV